MARVEQGRNPNVSKSPYYINQTQRHSPSRSSRPYHFELNGTALIKNFNSTQMYQWSTAIPSESKLQSITLPPNNPSRRLHLFAMSYTPSIEPRVTNTTSQTSESSATLSIRRVRFTTKWESLTKSEKAQIVEITLANLLPTSTLSKSTSINSNHTISIKGNGIKTVRPGSIVRLVPGDQARVDVLVTGTSKSNTGKNATVEVRDSHGKVVGSTGGWQISPLVEEWTVDADVLSRHEAPTWVSPSVSLPQLLNATCY